MSFLLLTSLSILGAAPAPFTFQENDRVVLIGGTLIEREQKYGDWELALTLLNQGKKVTFRNLGWSGDTVWGESRNYFDANPKGYDRLTKLTADLKPNLTIVCYGQNESYAGEAGLPAFVEQYKKLIADLKKTKARVVLVTPPPFEPTSVIPDVSSKNESLKVYVSAIVKLANDSQCDLFDLNQAVRSLPKTLQLTENGVHYGPEGYRLSSALWNPALPISDKTVNLPDGSDALRARIVAKNELYFHRWRPQNETYLFGFRKREQGQNAKEVDQFEPLVDKADQEIFELQRSMKPGKQ